MNCNRIARAYRWLEYLTFGRTLQTRRCAFLDQISSARNVLILGDGDGRFTAELVRRHTEVVVDSVESSPKMSRLAARRIARCTSGEPRVRQIQGDARIVPLTQRYDLIVSHFFLDCFRTEDLERFIPHISARLVPGGQWLISEFQVPARGLSRLLAALMIGCLYLAFRMLTGLEATRLPEYVAVLEGNGFRRIACQTAAGGMLVSELWEKG